MRKLRYVLYETPKYKKLSSSRMFGLLVLVGLFVALTPGILLKLKGKKMVSATAHAVLFFVAMSIYTYYDTYEGFKSVKAPSKFSPTCPPNTTLTDIPGFIPGTTFIPGMNIGVRCEGTIDAARSPATISCPRNYSSRGWGSAKFGPYCVNGSREVKGVFKCTGDGKPIGSGVNGGNNSDGTCFNCPAGSTYVGVNQNKSFVCKTYTTPTCPTGFVLNQTMCTSKEITMTEAEAAAAAAAKYMTIGSSITCMGVMGSFTGEFAGTKVTSLGNPIVFLRRTGGINSFPLSKCSANLESGDEAVATSDYRVSTGSRIDSGSDVIDRTMPTIDRTMPTIGNMPTIGKTIPTIAPNPNSSVFFPGQTIYCGNRPIALTVLDMPTPDKVRVSIPPGGDEITLSAQECSRTPPGGILGAVTGLIGSAPMPTCPSTHRLTTNDGRGNLAQYGQSINTALCLSDNFPPVLPSCSAGKLVGNICN